MNYLFLDPGDDKLIETSELSQEGIAVAVRSTGYDTDEDEVLQLSIVDLTGAELFFKTVHPQNKEAWADTEAAAHISPADVSDSPELYQFEDEISDLFEHAGVVVGLHMPFVEGIIESSWVTLPAFEKADLTSLFCASHCTDDYRGQPATVATLDGIARYYGVDADLASTTGEARAVAACYRALVREHAEKRAAKGDAYWKRRDERLAEEAARNDAADAVMRQREKNFNRMNGLLWVAAALIFVSLVIQLAQRGADVGFMVVCGAFAAFALVRAIANFRR